MHSVIKSCRNLLFLLVFTNCNNSGEPAALSIINDSTLTYPTVILKFDTFQHKVGKDNFDDVLSLFMVKDGRPVTSKVITAYTFRNDTLFMKPMFLPDAGAEFEAVAALGGDTTRMRFVIPKFSKIIPEPSVEQIYPTSDKIPENILMFHVVFNQSMNEDPLAYSNIKLVDENGDEKKMVWREKSNWTSDGRHLIMMIHPGWVKRDIHYLDKYGPEFKVGKKHTLIVTTQLMDKYGRNIKQEYKKEFTIVKSDREIPSVDRTAEIKVRQGIRDTLFISFSEPIDYGSALIGINVRDDKGIKVEGHKFPVSDNRWAFAPELIWEEKQYLLELTQELTDVASNHFHRRFEEEDIELMKPVDPIKIPFMPN